MKLAFTIFLIVGFSAMTILGFWSMGHEGHGACLASLAQGSLCPEAGSAFAFLNFHANAFKTFSSAVFESLSLASISIALLLLVVAMGFLTNSFSSPPSSIFQPYFKWRGQKPPFSAVQTFIGWWTLLEKRDPNAPAVF